MKSEVNQIRMKALKCLEATLLCFEFSEQDSFLCLIIDDPNIGAKLEPLTSIMSYSGVIADSRNWYFVLKSFSTDLYQALGSVARTSRGHQILLWLLNEKEACVLCAVKGLQWLSPFPPSCSSISKGCYEDVLEILMSIISSESEETYLWNLSLTEPGPNWIVD